jgi:hypothetical protein
VPHARSASAALTLGSLPRSDPYSWFLLHRSSTALQRPACRAARASCSAWCVRAARSAALSLGSDPTVGSFCTAAQQRYSGRAAGVCGRDADVRAHAAPRRAGALTRRCDAA